MPKQQLIGKKGKKNLLEKVFIYFLAWAPNIENSSLLFILDKKYKMLYLLKKFF